MHIYFSGIGGVGIGPLAMLAQDADYSVTGSDKSESVITKELSARNITLTICDDASAIEKAHNEQPIDLLVHSAAIPDTHPEMQFAHEHNIPTAKRHELINKILSEKNLKLIAISGTHGKTTSTGMAIWAFKQLGLPVSYSVGSQISFGPTAAYQQGSEYFVYEADEFDRNMLQFQPYVALVTSVDFDHPDTYRDHEDYESAFSEFIAHSESAYVWQDDATKLNLSDTTTVLKQVDVANTSLALIGNHSRTNAYMVAQAIASLIDRKPDELYAALNDFPGTARRFEKLKDNLYTDYAHHPVEIEKTIQLARELNENVVIVYQPHQNIRQHELYKTKGYENAFLGAKKVYWLPTYLSREDPNLPILNPEDFIETLSNKDTAQPAEMNSDLKNAIETAVADGALVVAMSAGDLDSWVRTNI